MFLKIAIFAFVAVAAAQLGGWSNADIKSPEVIEATKFAIDNKFIKEHPHFIVTEAKKQVVAGMKYDMIVEVFRPGKECQVHHFQVWNRFGEMTLVENEVLDKKCDTR